MTYYLNTTVPGKFDDVVESVIQALKAQGFGVLTDIDVKDTLKQKIGAEFRNYRILGACNPPLALKALTAEDKIGVMLPCNVIVQEHDGGKVEVAAIDPRVQMGKIDNPSLSSVGGEVAGKLEAVIKSLA